MNKFSKFFMVALVVLVCPIVFAACGGGTPKDIVTDATSCNITSWYDVTSTEKALDTSVTFDNSVLPYGTWLKVTFVLSDAEENKLTEAYSEGENLKTLLEDAEQYWPESSREGNLILSNAFKTRTETNDNGYWVREAFACTPNSEVQPAKLKVSIETEDKIYECSFEVNS